MIVVEAKSQSSHRLIPLPDFILEMASKYKQPPNCYIISTSHGKFIEPRVMQYQFKKCMEVCGIKDVNFHALRHTFATRCIEAGFDIKTLSEILGHSSVKITLEKYVHSSLELKRINMEIEAILIAFAVIFLVRIKVQSQHARGIVPFLSSRGILYEIDSDR